MGRPNTRPVTGTRGMYRPAALFCSRTHKARDINRDIRLKSRQSFGLVCRAVSTTLEFALISSGNPGGKEPVGGRALAVPQSLWVLGQLVWGRRNGGGDVLSLARLGPPSMSCFTPVARADEVSSKFGLPPPFLLHLLAAALGTSATCRRARPTSAIGARSDSTRT